MTINKTNATRVYRKGTKARLGRQGDLTKDMVFKLRLEEWRPLGCLVGTDTCPPGSIIKINQTESVFSFSKDTLNRYLNMDIGVVQGALP
jgi:hypothetical protein